MSAGGRAKKAEVNEEVPPMKIACSLYYSASIGNRHQGRAAGKTLTYAWGRDVGLGNGSEDCFGIAESPHDPRGDQGKAVSQELLSPVPVYTRDDSSGPAHTGNDSKTREPRFLENAKEVACGLNHMLFLVDDKIYASGLGQRGRLGIERGKGPSGEAEARWFQGPKPVNFDEKLKVKVLKICCGSDHSLAICDRDGKHEVYSWGMNNEGQCGVGDTNDVRRPRLVEIPSSSQKPTHIAAGGRHSLLVTSPAPQETSTKASEKELGSQTGSCYSWGCALQGRLGLADAAKIELRPRLVDELKTNATNPKFVAAGEAHSGLIDHAGHVWMWGVGSYGRLGLGEEADVKTPQRVEGVLLDIKVNQIALGGFHSVALLGGDAPKVFAWGRGEALGLLREGDSSIVRQPRVVSIEEPSDTTAALDKSKAFKVTQIAAGMYHTLLLLLNGDILAYGLGANGRLGLGHTKNVTRPMKVKTLALHDSHPTPVGFAFADPDVSKKTPTPPSTAPSPEVASAASPPAFGVDAGAKDSAPGTSASSQVQLAARHAAQGAGEAARRGGSAREASPPQDAMTEAPTEATEAADMADTDVDKDIHDDDNDKSAGPNLTFHTLQKMLREEKPDAAETKLKEREKQVKTKLMELMKAIAEIPKKEAKLVLLRSNFDASFAQNLRYIKAAKACASGDSGIITPYLETYEDLCWILQQQVAYLVSLAMCVETAEEQKTLYHVCKCLFGELEDQRTLHLFEALLRLLASKEIDKSKKLEDVFNPGQDSKDRDKDRSSALHLFSWFALNEIHYTGLVHKFMDSKLDRSLIKSVINASENNECFALSSEDFKKHPLNPTAGDLGKKELESDFLASLGNFDVFMKQTFLAEIKNVRLPDSLKKYFAYCYTAIEKRRFTAVNEKKEEGGRDAADKGATTRMAVGSASVLPLLNLFVMGVLVPMLRNAKHYGGRQAYLTGKFEDGEDNATNANIKALANFLEKMLEEDKLDKNDSSQYGLRRVRSIMNDIRAELLKYVRDQIFKVEDNINTMLLLDVCLSHFDMRTHTVLIPSSVMMKVSVMLRKNITKLSINNQDPVDELCKKIKEWTQQEIANTEKDDDKLHVFEINTRFLFDDKDKNMVICDSSNCPVPARMSSKSPDEEFDDLVTPLEEGDTRFRHLEDVLVKAKTDFQKATTLTALKKELELELGQMKDSEVSVQITLSLEKIQDMITLDAKVADIINPIKACLDARRRHLTYLVDLKKGLKEVEKAQRRHDKALKEAANLMAAVNTFSRNLKLPNKLTEAARQSNVTLRLESVHDTVKRRGEFGRSEDIQELSFSPLVTLTLKKLSKMKVVTSNRPSLDKADCKLSFLLANGGAEITVTVKRNGHDGILKQSIMDEEKLRDLRKTDENATMPFPEGANSEEEILRFNRAKLAELLADVAAGRV